MVFRYITVCFPFFYLYEYKVEGGLEVLVVFTRICKGEEYGYSSSPQTKPSKKSFGMCASMTMFIMFTADSELGHCIHW